MKANSYVLFLIFALALTTYGSHLRAQKTLNKAADDQYDLVDANGDRKSTRLNSSH